MKHMHVTAAHAKLLVKKEKLEKELMMLVAQIERETTQMDWFMRDDLACAAFAEVLEDVEQAGTDGLNQCFVVLPGKTEDDEVRVAIFKALLEERRFVVEQAPIIYDKTPGGEFVQSTSYQLTLTW